MNFTLRPCTMNDLDFILTLKELGMKWYIEKLYGWNTEIQRQKTKKELDENLQYMNIVTVNNKDVGVTTFCEYEQYYQVGLIIIHPDYQNQGIASKIISDYIQTAKIKKKRIIIKTFKENPAQKLYQRLGFKIYETDNSHLHMEINFNK